MDTQTTAIPQNLRAYFSIWVLGHPQIPKRGRFTDEKPATVRSFCASGHLLSKIAKDELQISPSYTLIRVAPMYLGSNSGVIRVRDS